MKSKSLINIGNIILFIATLFLYLKFPNFNWPLLIIILVFGFISYNNKLSGLLLIIFLTLFGEFSRLNFLGRSLLLSDLLIAEFLIIFFYHQQFRFKLNKKSSKLYRLQLFFLTIAGISLLLSLFSFSFREILPGLEYFIRLIEYTLLFPVTISIIRSSHNPAKTRNIILNSILCITALLAIIGFIQLITFPNLKELADNLGYDPHINRLFSTWLDPNLLGGLFAFILTFFLVIWFYQRKSFLKKILTAIALIVIAIALFLTYSRSAYLAFAVGILLIGLIKSPRLLIMILMISVIGISFSKRAQHRLDNFYNTANSIIFNIPDNTDPTAQFRLQNWQQTIFLINQKPLLGQGYNNLSLVKAKAEFIQNTAVHSASGSDSSILTILATTGILGLIPYLLIFISIIMTGWQNFKTSSKRLKKGYGLAITLALTTLLIHSNFVNSLLFPEIMTYLWISTALFYSLL